MSIDRTTVFLATLLALASGCRSTSVASRSFDSSTARATNIARTDNISLVNEPLPEPAESAERNHGQIEQVSAEASIESNSAAASGTSVVRYSIGSAIETALAQNPDLVALRQAEGVGSAAVGVAQTYPFNPFVQIQATPYQDARNAGPGTTYHYVLLMQQIQLGNQQQFREEAGCAALNGIRWNVLQAELLNVAQTERLYFAAIYQQGLRDLANMNAQNNRQLLNILERQKDLGQATAADVAIVRLDVRSTTQQQRIAEASLQTALLDLKRHLCLPVEYRIELDDTVLNWNWQSTTASQLASIATNRPDVMAARADADTARANANFANASRIPDVQLGPYYQRNDSGVTFLGFRAQMDLPVLNDGMPLLRQREAEYCQRATSSQQLAIRARLEAEAASDRYERARSLRVETGEPTRASVPVELQRLEEQFQANEVDILRVLQARNSLLQCQRADLDALNELMQAAVAVTVATGAPLESLTQQTANSNSR